MALSGTEYRENGFVKSTTTGAIVVTTTTTGATVKNGFLTDPDGRLVVVSV